LTGDVAERKLVEDRKGIGFSVFVQESIGARASARASNRLLGLKVVVDVVVAVVNVVVASGCWNR
jgi:hypothetical protein